MLIHLIKGKYILIKAFLTTLVDMYLLLIHWQTCHALIPGTPRCGYRNPILINQNIFQAVNIIYLNLTTKKPRSLGAFLLSSLPLTLSFRIILKRFTYKLSVFA